MASATTTSEVMRVVLSSSMKTQFQAKCAKRGQKMSERMRQLIAEDLAQEHTAAENLSDILASAAKKNEASSLPLMTIDDIDAFIESVRDERISSGHVS